MNGFRLLVYFVFLFEIFIMKIQKQLLILKLKKIKLFKNKFSHVFPINKVIFLQFFVGLWFWLNIF